jgi:hypothetical protein
MKRLVDQSGWRVARLLRCEQGGKQVSSGRSAASLVFSNMESGRRTSTTDPTLSDLRRRGIGLVLIGRSKVSLERIGRRRGEEAKAGK